MAGLAQQVDDWLLREALGKPTLEQIFEKLCSRLMGIGIPIARARLNWPTLHPLFRAEMIKWHRDAQKAELEHFHHQDTNSEAWQQSPLRYMLESDLPVFRRRLIGRGKLVDFPLLRELADEGYTDYVAFKTDFTEAGMFMKSRAAGIFVIWTTDRQTGFSAEDISVLQEIQLTLALVCKSIIQSQITTNIVETYLGRQAGRSVLNGNIRLGDGAKTKALVWYSDLRNSTRLTGSLPSDAFLELLNVYFECAARPAIQAGGEVLAFIGDAVLVIFPFEEACEMCDLSKKMLHALASSLRMRDLANADRQARGLELIDFGIGLNAGDVVFGNIGVPERLTFTVIGPTVTEVERIEKLTKTMQTNILATHEIAALAPESWISVGKHPLDGVAHPMELFEPRMARDELLLAAAE